MKKVGVFFGIILSTFAWVNAQTNCNNRDFEDSTFVNWTGSTGSNSGLLTTLSYTNGLVSNGLDASISDALARHTLITQNYIDTNCIDPVTLTYDSYMTSLAPGGGTVSVRLGNSQVGMEMERLGHQYPVNSGNALYTYQYACVQNDPGHNWDAQPFFMVNFYDINGNFLLGDTIYAGQQNVPFIPSTNGNKYRRWSTITVDLTPYVGQTVYVEFVNADCAFGGHYGYTYLDVSCLGALTPNVWPGDCDYDLACNYVDGLSLGIAFGTTGTARTTMGYTWAATASTDWGTQFPLGVDYKHSDCDGNGTVGWSDVQAIIQNYNSIHPFKPVSSESEHHTKTAALPLLQIIPSVTNIGPGNVVNFDIQIGTSTNPIQNLYGIGFQLNYPENLIISGSAQGDFNGSWLGTSNQTALSIFHAHSGSGFSDFVLSKINQQDTTGYGKIASFQLTTGSPSVLTALPLTFSGVYAITENMTRIPLQTQSCTLNIDPSLPASLNTDNEKISFSLYPNPARNEVNISLNEFSPAIIQVYSLTGQLLLTERMYSASATLSTTELPAGMYWIELSDGFKRTTKSLVITRN